MNSRSTFWAKSNHNNTYYDSPQELLKAIAADYNEGDVVYIYEYRHKHCEEMLKTSDVLDWLENYYEDELSPDSDIDKQINTEIKDAIDGFITTINREMCSHNLTPTGNEMRFIKGKNEVVLGSEIVRWTLEV